MPEFTQDKYDPYPNRWICEDCNAVTRRVEKPTVCDNCRELAEPIHADRWRLTGRSVKIGEKLDKHGGIREEVYLSVDYSRPCAANGYRDDIMHLGCDEAWDNGVRGSTIVDNLTTEQCAELAVMFWKLSQGWPLENMEKQEVS